eukprot:GHVR01152286.1.p1 GENE.GHVR01152286.1~~GHVR01152286.1.p1  ORF type:complete len:216 (-),score=40.24 GHVR01152286.1:899-1546(-)
MDSIKYVITYITNRLRKAGHNTSQSDAINKFSKRIANSVTMQLSENTSVVSKPLKGVYYEGYRATVISTGSTGMSTSVGDGTSSGMCLPPICSETSIGINTSTLRLGEVINKLGIRTTRRSSVPSNARLSCHFSSAELAKFHRICVCIVASWSTGVVMSLASPSVIESLPKVLPRKKYNPTLDEAMTQIFHPDKAERGGEDACAILSDGSDGRYC